MKRIRTVFLPLILAAVLLLGGCESTDSTSQITNLLAVGTEQCTMKEARVYLANMRSAYSNVSGVNLWTGVSEAASASGDSAAQVLSDLVVSRLLYIYCFDQMATEAGVSLSSDEESLISQAAAAYIASLTTADQTYLDVDTGDIEAYYSHFALAEKYYAQETADVILSRAASSEEEEEQLIEEAKAQMIQDAYEDFIAGVEIVVDEDGVSQLALEAAADSDASSDAQDMAALAASVSTNQFFSIYNEYMSEQ